VQKGRLVNREQKSQKEVTMNGTNWEEEKRRRTLARAEGWEEGIRQGRLEFRSEFRERAARILSSASAQGRYPLALAMVLETDLSTEAIAAILSGSPTAAGADSNAVFLAKYAQGLAQKTELSGELSEDGEVAAILSVYRALSGQPCTFA
jgi:hypothetical protein